MPPLYYSLTFQTLTLTKMLDIWSWIFELPNSEKWADSNSNSFSPLVFELVNSEQTQNNKTTQSIYLKAERTSGSNTEAMLTFSICIQGFHPHKAQKTLWVSETCPISSDKPFLPLVLQLLNEIITRSPTANASTCPKSQLRKLERGPVYWVMDSHSPESFSRFFNVIFLTRLFWLCAFDVPSEVGTLYFQYLLSPHIESFSCDNVHVLRTFFISVGVDAELCFMRAVGYMLSKWLILREVKLGVGLKTLTPLPNVGVSYANEVHGLWVLKGYVPVLAMDVMRCNGHKSHFPIVEANESLLRYALAHQQLEAVVQLEYSVVFHEGYIQVKTRMDNMRFHVVRLGYNKNEENGLLGERYFPSRIKVWVGPEFGATYVGGLSLGRSTENGEKETEMSRIVKGTFAKSKMSKVKARARMSTKSKIKNWRWDQDVDGNAVVFDAVLCDNIHGHEVCPSNTSNDGFRQRYTSSNRPFTKSGGVVFARDEYGEEVGWRLSREMEGSVLKWRIGGQVWLSYVPNDVNSSCYETRTVEWCDEVDLPLFTS